MKGKQMYILVNYSDDYGLNCFGKFDSHKEAYEHIADSVMKYYGNDFDIMSIYPINANHELEDNPRYKDNETEIFAGMNWCNCFCKDYSDYYLIIEI